MDSSAKASECSSGTPPPSKKARGTEEMRNWVNLPPDVTSRIFKKLGPVELMVRVQFVCKTWFELCKQPQFYRYVDVRLNSLGKENWKYGFVNLVKEAMDRSCGEMVELAVENYSSYEFLREISAKCSSLKCLRFYRCGRVSRSGLIEMAKTLSKLEELEISFCKFPEEALETFGQSCPQLKSLRLNQQGVRIEVMENNTEALIIAKNMPGLQHLNLLGTKLTNEGLHAILDGCPHLKSLDLRHCFGVELVGDLRERCLERNIQYKLPNDSIADYDYKDYREFDDYPDGEYTTADMECYCCCSSPETPPRRVLSAEEEAKRQEQEYFEFLSCL